MALPIIAPDEHNILFIISKLAFIILVGHIGMTIQLQFDCIDSLTILFQADSICFLAAQDMLDYFTAFLNILVRRPSGDWVNIRIAGVFV